MTDFKLIIVIFCVVFFLIGFVIGKLIKKPLGEIIFSPSDDVEDAAMKCIFKLDMEIEDMAKQNYILFKVIRSQK